MNKKKVLEILENKYGWEGLGKSNILLNDTIKATKEAFSIKEIVPFEDFMTNFCKHGITLTQNYTGETISLKDLIRKYKLTNNKSL